MRGRARHVGSPVAMAVAGGADAPAPARGWTPTEALPGQPIPWRAVPLALAALAVPTVGALYAPGWIAHDTGLLLWLTPILPAFLLAYYRGWRGAALALAFAMASLAVAHVAFLLASLEPPGWPLMLSLVVAYLVLTQGVAALAEMLHRARRDAERLAVTDSLTGLANRREAERVLDRASDAALRGAGLSIVLFDLDRFKAVNDEHGHAVGDVVIREMAEVLRRETRGMDLSARIGGEEFLSVLPGSGVVAGVAFAQRVRRALAGRTLPCGPVTVSAGVAAATPEMGSADLLLAAADDALYRAKAEGRDRVCVQGGAGAPAAPSPASDEHDRYQPSRERSMPNPIESRPMAGARIMVLDDDPQLRGAAVRALTSQGYRAAGAASAAEAFRAEGPLDLLVCDLVLPGLSGREAASTLQARNPGMKVLFMSGYSSFGSFRRAIEGAGESFLGKPFGLPELLVAVRSALSGDAGSSSPAAVGQAGR